MYQSVKAAPRWTGHRPVATAMKSLNRFGSAHISHNQVANATVSLAVAGLAVPAVALAREDAPIAAGLLQSVLGPAQAS